MICFNIACDLWRMLVWSQRAARSEFASHCAIWCKSGAGGSCTRFERCPMGCWGFQQGQALVLNAFAEIGVGFLLLLGLLSPARSILLTLIYWKNVLPVRYHSPDAASYHRQVCAKPHALLAIMTIESLVCCCPTSLLRMRLSFQWHSEKWSNSMRGTGAAYMHHMAPILGLVSTGFCL